MNSFYKLAIFLIALITAGTITAQNVGIGNINPGSKLSVTGNLAIGSSTYSAAAAPTNGAIIEGNVGIGVPSPTYKLAVAGTGNFTGLLSGSAGISFTGADANINVSSNFNTNINTGSSNGTITMGNLSGASITRIYSGTATGNALLVSDNNLSTGSGINVTSTSTAGNGSSLLKLTRSGANASNDVINYGMLADVSNTGTNSTNIAASLRANGGTSNIALRLRGATSGYVDLSPSAATTSYSLVLPSQQAASAGLALINDGAGNLSWADPTAGSSFSLSSQDNFEDFVFDDYSGSGSNDNQFSFTQATSGTNASSEVDGNVGATYGGGNDYAGLHILSTGTTSSGRAGLGSFNNYNKMKVGGKEVAYEARVRIETLSTGSQTFTTYFGLMDLADGATSGNPANGVYFTYTHGTNSGRWVGVSRSSSSSSTTNSSVTVTANQWYKLRAVVNATGTEVDFYVDNVLIGSTTTNIPTANAMKFVFKIEKSAGSTARTCSIDYFTWRMVR